MRGQRVRDAGMIVAGDVDAKDTGLRLRGHAEGRLSPIRGLAPLRSLRDDARAGEEAAVADIMLPRRVARRPRRTIAG